MSTEAYDALKDKRAWDVAIAPAKSLPMQAFMLYMSGGGVQIFSIGIVFMLLLSPFKNMDGLNEGKCTQLVHAVIRLTTITASFRPIRAHQQEGQLAHNASASEDRVYPLQFVDSGCWPMEVPVNGSVTNGNR